MTSAKEAPTSSIRVEIRGVDPILGVKPTHADLVFNIDGKEFRIIGYPYNAQTGMPTMHGSGAEVFTQDHRLKAMVTPNSPDVASGWEGHFHGSKENHIETQTLFTGDSASVLERFAKALKAVDHINKSDISYHAVGLIVPGQNSNSVVGTVLHAIGLEYKPTDPSHSAHGNNRILTPHGWDPGYNGLADQIRVGGGLPENVRSELNTIIETSALFAITDRMKFVQNTCASLAATKTEIDMSALCAANTGFVSRDTNPEVSGTKLESLAQETVGQTVQQRQKASPPHPAARL